MLAPGHLRNNHPQNVCKNGDYILAKRAKGVNILIFTARHFPEIYESLAVPASKLHPGMAGSLLLLYQRYQLSYTGQSERLILHGVGELHTLEFLQNVGRLLHFQLCMFYCTLPISFASR